MSAAQANELMSFLVGEQEFCVDIMAVREIRGWTASTPLPHAPEHVLGVINLRGVVLPVIDLKARLGLGASVPTSAHVIMVVCVDQLQIGLLVDAVCDILTATDDMLQRPPNFGSVQTADIVLGVMTLDRGLVTLIDLAGVAPHGLEIAA